MNDYFEREFLILERELVRLKTAAQRSSGTVATVSKTIKVVIPLSLNSSGTSCSGDITYRVIPETNSLVIATLDWYHENIQNDWEIPRTSRAVALYETQVDNGGLQLRVAAEGTQYSSTGTSDVQKLQNGQSVSIEVNLTILATNNFTIMEVA